MPAQLVALNDGPCIVVDKPILLLGRHPECDVQIDSRKISRRHCCIAQVNDYLVVRDLDSTNGIRINGVRVVEGKLKPGDEVTIGSNRYRVTSGDSPAPPRAAARPVPLDDDALEECDEPVPLQEPSRAAEPRPAPKPTPPPPPKKQASDEDSVLIPEDLQLLPSHFGQDK